MKPVLIPDRIYFRIGDVAELLGVKPYVIRFWEGEFPFLAPDKASSGQRVYRRTQIESLILVKHLLHVERYSIEGAKKKLTELRREGKMKETMMKLVEGDVQIGSTVSKENLPAALQASIQEKVSELQKIIRDPSLQGIQVPGLAVLSKRL
jgi:DNA-binding transcriptional MerR regulator